MDKGTNPTVAGRRLSEILHAEELAEVFGISVSQARQNLAAGIYGPRFKVGKRYGILRAKLLGHLEELSELPSSDIQAMPVGTRATELIRDRRTQRRSNTNH